MGAAYTLQSGDTLSGIASQFGYPNWQHLYNHSENADFKASHPNPSAIQVGDVIVLPDKETDSGPPPDSSPPPDSTTTPENNQPRRTRRRGTASRRTPSRDSGTTGPPGSPSTGRTTLGARYELREIVVAQGIEHLNTNPWMKPGRSGPTPHGWRIPRGLEVHFPNNSEHEWENMADKSADFVSHTQRVRYKIRVIEEKDEYKRCLETPGLHVIYMGHSRYGRGQCFGPVPEPGDDWEQGSDTSTKGLFRTGFGVIGIHFSEMRKHDYQFYPVPASVPIRSGWRHPDVPSSLRRVSLPSDLHSKLLPVAGAVQDRYWGYRDREGDTILLWAGWKETISKPMDLDAVDLKCRCLCIFSCSTRRHYWKLVRKRKNWTRTSTDKFAYFTTAVSYPLTTWAWLRALFEYSTRNDFDSWYPSLESAKRRCRSILRTEGYSYGIY